MSANTGAESTEAELSAERETLSYEGFGEATRELQPARHVGELPRCLANGVAEQLPLGVQAGLVVGHLALGAAQMGSVPEAVQDGHRERPQGGDPEGELDDRAVESRPVDAHEDAVTCRVRRARSDDDDRAGGVLGHRHPHRSEQQAGDRAATS